MTWVAGSLYALGAIGGTAAVSREAPMGLREYVVVIAWPLAIAAAVGLGLINFVRRACRP